MPSNLSHATASLLKRSVEHCMSLHRVSRLVIDMSLVEVVTSIGMTSLLEVRQTAEDAGVPMVLAGLSEPHMQFFTLLRVDRLFVFVETVERAVADEG